MSIDKDRYEELMFLIDIDHPIYLMLGTQVEVDALLETKKNASLVEKFNHKGLDHGSMFSDIYTVVDLLYCGIFDIIDIAPNKVVTIVVNQPLTIYNGTEINYLTYKQEVRFEADDMLLQELHEYEYNNAKIKY
jgi:hypothetical protein